MNAVIIYQGKSQGALRFFLFKKYFKDIFEEKMVAAEPFSVPTTRSYHSKVFHHKRNELIT